MAKSNVSFNKKATKSKKRFNSENKVSKAKGKNVKKVRFSKEVQSTEFERDTTPVIDDELLNSEEDEDVEALQEQLDDEEKEFLEKTKRGESYPIVRDASDDEDDSDSNDSDDNFDYNATIDELKKNDPEFYEYLLKNDKDLMRIEAGEEAEVESDDDLMEEDEDEECANLEVPKVTHSYINKLSEELKEKCDRDLILKAIKLFKMAIEGTEDESGKTKLYSPDVLSSIIHLCLLDLLPAIHKFLKLPSPTAAKKSDAKPIDPSKSKNWKKLVSPIKTYLQTVVKVFDVVSEASVVVTLLRHCLYLIPFFNCYIPLLKRLMKKAIEFWSEGEETGRVLSFLIIVRLLKNEEKEMISFVVKKLYFSYIKNCKFTTPQNWALILFMRQSLVELYSLNNEIAYNQAFVFIRQCAISLRNALSSKQKDSFKAVFNWQYVHSLLLWSQLLSSNLNEVLKPLIHPLVQVMIGTIRLLPVAKNLPLRFHIIKGLTQLSAATDTFIPILPYITESLELLDCERKPKVGTKKVNFDCVLRVSKQQVYEKQFIEAAVDKVYELLLEYLSTQSNSIAFPELVFIGTVRIRRFLKKCKVSSYCRLLKQAVDKIDENSKFIEENRRKTNIAITDASEINNWEKNIKEKGTPITKFYTQWKKLRVAKEKREMEKNANEEEDEEENEEVSEEDDDHQEENDEGNDEEDDEEIEEDQ